MLTPECATYNGRSTFANPKYLKIAQYENPRLYEIPYDTSDPANRFCPNGEETVTLKKESRSKLDYTYQNSLYETFKPPSKTYLDQLERAKEVRKTMWRKTFVRTKPNIAKNVAFLPISKSISKSRQLYNEMTNNFNHFRTICQQTWSNHTNSAFPNPTAKTMEVLIKTLLMPLSNKTILDSHCFVHELKKEMHDDLEYVKSLEKEIDELESEKADFSNIYDLLLEECVSKDVTCSYLHSLSDLNANTELQCLYLHKVKECECLALKLSKQTESVNNEMKNNPVCKENASNVFRKEREQYHEIQDLKAQMQDKNMVINELKKLILVTKGKSVETRFEKPSVVRQPNAQRIPKPSVLGRPTPFSNSPKMRSSQTKQSANKTNVSDGLFQPVTPQNLPQYRNQAVRNTNVLKQVKQAVQIHNSKSSGVILNFSVSRPQLKSYQVKGKGRAKHYHVIVYKGRSWFKGMYRSKGLFRRRPQSKSFAVGQFCDADLEVVVRNLLALYTYIQPRSAEETTLISNEWLFPEDEFINLFVTPVPEIGEFPHASLILRCAFISTQSHDFRWTEIILFRTSSWNPSCSLNKTTACHRSEMCMFAAHSMLLLKRRTLRGNGMFLHGIRARQDENFISSTD
ncbi:hypothetical protein Tco_0661110 [Tanacetum coccineum]